jgi:hypothetical protein
LSVFWSFLLRVWRRFSILFQHSRVLLRDDPFSTTHNMVD